MLWRNSLIMNDRDTGSDWSHITGECVNGPLKGTHLEVIPAVQTTWSGWVKEHPQTSLLKKEAAVLSSHYESYFKDDSRAGLFRTSWLTDRLPAKAKVHGVTVGPFALAVVDESISAGDPVFSELGDESVVVVRGSDGGVRAYSRRLDERRLEFEPIDDSVLYRDAETGSQWDLASGACVEGELKGSSLAPLQIGVYFWFAWSSFYPNTEVID